MSDDRHDDPTPSGYASPPCFAHEVDPAYSGLPPAPPSDIAAWRRAERERLRAERAALPVARRQEIAAALADALTGLVRETIGPVEGRVVSGYWPIKSEPDLRSWLAGTHAAGALTALPVVETRRAPLVFRPWSPGTRMIRGDWNIPVPPPEAGAVIPEIVLAPLIGWTAEGYRLGYGGGYFDRTLASLSPRPFAIGIGLTAARLVTIYPQPHDIRLDAIVTEDGVQVPPRS